MKVLVASGLAILERVELGRSHNRWRILTVTKGRGADISSGEVRQCVTGLRGERRAQICGVGAGSGETGVSQLSTPAGNRSAGRQNALALEIRPQAAANRLTLRHPIARL
jgi:hypothetical protein